MDEMEYVKWYSTHLLERYEQDGEEYVFNDLSLLTSAMSHPQSLQCPKDGVVWAYHNATFFRLKYPYNIIIYVNVLFTDIYNYDIKRFNIIK